MTEDTDAMAREGAIAAIRPEEKASLQKSRLFIIQQRYLKNFRKTI
jgi:hypothetical protein